MEINEKSQINEVVSSNDNFINIRPNTDIYNFFRRLPYTFEQVFYELIDNSIDSFWKNSEALKNTKEDKSFKLKINIIWDPDKDRVIVEDNAFGMNWENFERAFVLNVPPNDSNYKSEFGLGLKTAACWLGKEYTISTTELGNDREFSATLDSEFLKKTKEENLKVRIKEVERSAHYTIIIIKGLRKKINDYFWSTLVEKITRTYCFDIEKLNIEIRCANSRYEDIKKIQPLNIGGKRKLLKNREGAELKSRFTGRVKIEGGEISFEGLVMLLETMNPRETGLYFFRRGRLIIGDNGKEKPWVIFGDGSSHFSKRCRIVVWIDQIPVSFNKSSFDISEEDKDSFEKLLDEIVRGKNDAKLNLKSFASKHRKDKKMDLEKTKESKKNEASKGTFLGSDKESEQTQSSQEKSKSVKNSSNLMEESNILHVDNVINNDLENYLDLYKIKENHVSIQINKKRFLENYILLKEDEKWCFFEKTLINIITSFLLLKLGSNYLWRDSDITSEFFENINKSFRNLNKKEK